MNIFVVLYNLLFELFRVIFLGEIFLCELLLSFNGFQRCNLKVIKGEVTVWTEFSAVHGLTSLFVHTRPFPFELFAVSTKKHFFFRTHQNAKRDDNFDSENDSLVTYLIKSVSTVTPKNIRYFNALYRRRITSKMSSLFAVFFAQ